MWIQFRNTTAILQQLRSNAVQQLEADKTTSGQLSTGTYLYLYNCKLDYQFKINMSHKLERNHRAAALRAI